jgi:hypothetical protein
MSQSSQPLRTAAWVVGLLVLVGGGLLIRSTLKGSDFQSPSAAAVATRAERVSAEAVLAESDGSTVPKEREDGPESQTTATATHAPRVPMRAPSGALTTGSLTNETTSTSLAAADGDTTETDRERWKRLGLELVPVRIVEAGTSRPLEGVRVKFDGVHGGQSPGSFYSHGGWIAEKHGPAPSGVTDGEGRVILASPVTITDLMLVTGISYTAQKPGYASRRVSRYPVDGTERDEALSRGNTLFLRVVREDTGRPVTEFIPLLSHTAQVKPDDWVSLPDGSKRLDILPNGSHMLSVMAKLPDGPNLHSKTEVIKLSGGETQDLTLTVKPGLTLRGQLSSNVPRPVTGGTVLACTQDPPPGTRKGGPTMMRYGQAPIAADGTFEVANLPEGMGEIIAVCDGFVASYSIPFAKPWQGLMNQTFDLKPESKPMVLSMDPTGSLRVQVLDDRGAPLAGATVAAWPNVQWATGTASLYVDGKLWRSLTGADGVATIRNLRSGDQDYAVHAEGWNAPAVLDWEQRITRSLVARITVGETTTSIVRMERAAEGSP